MSNLEKLNLDDMFGAGFPSTEDRLGRAYVDPVVWERSRIIMKATSEERPGLQTELTTYLAAAYALFPEESEPAIDSLNRAGSGRSDGEA